MNKAKINQKQKKYTSFFLIFILLLSSISITSCSKSFQDKNTPPVTKSSFLLNTIVTITLYDSTDESIIDEAFQLCSDYEHIFSRTLETSELYKLNNGLLEKDEDSYLVSDQLATMLKDGYYYSNLSNGAFDITIEPISSLWDFQAKEPTLPDQSTIKKNLPFVNYKNLTINNNKVSFAKEGMGIDLGAIAKGYIADRLKEFLLSKGVNSAMINLGGNVLCVGSKPTGEPFNVGIQKPFADRNETVAVMQLDDLSVVSSGIYERYITVDGKQYHHILNPSTGYPYENNLISVTIISDKSVDGDGLSTSCFALGLEKGMKLINSLDHVYAVFITDDYEFHYSDGFTDAITITEQ